MHTRALVTQHGDTVQVQSICFGPSPQTVQCQIQNQLRAFIQQTSQEHDFIPNAAEVREAVRNGFWWRELGSDDINALILEPVHVAPALQSPDSVVEIIGRPCALTEHRTQPASSTPPKLNEHLQSGGFVVLTYAPDANADRHFEAWAYSGPLDFDKASPLCFGLGADPGQAFNALDLFLHRNGR